MAVEQGLRNGKASPNHQRAEVICQDQFIGGSLRIPHRMESIFPVHECNSRVARCVCNARGSRPLRYGRRRNSAIRDPRCLLSHTPDNRALTTRDPESPPQLPEPRIALKILERRTHDKAYDRPVID